MLIFIIVTKHLIKTQIEPCLVTPINYFINGERRGWFDKIFLWVVLYPSKDI